MATVAKAVTLHGTLRIPFVEQGDLTGMPILLLHGYTDSWRSFEPLLRRLPRGLRAVAPTQRGHGDAGRPAEGYGQRDFAADALALMDALGIGRALVVGHSMGSQVAMRLAQDHPDRVLGLVLIGAFASLGRNAAVREFWDGAVRHLTDPVDRGFVEDFQRSTLARPVPPEFFETVVRESLKLPARVWRAVLRDLMEAGNEPDAAGIAAPTLLLWGDGDGFCPREEQERLASGIAGARLVALEGTGHAPQWEEPDRVAAEIAAFADTLADAGRRAAS